MQLIILLAVFGLKALNFQKYKNTDENLEEIVIKANKIFFGLSIFIVAFTASVLVLPMTTETCAAERCRETASGNGTLIMPDGTRRRFSFDAQGRPNGTATGEAIIHNPEFDFRGRIVIKCLDVVGNRARVAGILRDTNDPNLDNNTAVFEVFDNGNGNARRNEDTISLVFFSPPNSPPPTPAYCQSFEGFDQMEIDRGDIEVDDCRR